MKLLALIKKEFIRFFQDPRLWLTLLLPGVVIFAVYTLRGSLMHQAEKYDFRVLVAGESQTVALIEGAVKGMDGATLKIEQTGDPVAAKEKVQKGDATALIIFSENFDERVDSYTPELGVPAPQVEIYYRSEDTESFVFYNMASSVLDVYEGTLANKFDLNGGEEKYDFSDADGLQKSIFGSILPFLIVVLVFSSCMSITLESVAGEKERGTLATVLVTSVKRSHVALGKIIPLSCIAAIGALSSFLGVALSMPKLMGLSVGAVVGSYGFLSYFFIFLLTVGVVPLLVSLISIVSTYSRSVKEASGYTGVMMMLVMVLSIVSVFVGGIGNWVVAVPIINAVVAMQGVLAGTAPVWVPLTAFAVNLAYTALLVFGITKMLSSERIMFGK